LDLLKEELNVRTVKPLFDKGEKLEKPFWKYRTYQRKIFNRLTTSHCQVVVEQKRRLVTKAAKETENEVEQVVAWFMKPRTKTTIRVWVCIKTFYA
jgi:hypothetical protein